MFNSKKQQKLSIFYRVTLLVALVFLVFGLAFLGSFRSTGKAYELVAKGETDAETPAVIFHLTNSTKETEDGGTETTRLRVAAVYVNVGAVYQTAGQSGVLQLDWASTSSSSFNSTTRRAKLAVENFFTAPPAEEEDAEDEEEAPLKSVKLFSWGAFEPEDDSWTVSSQPYVRLIATECNLLVNEVVFVGEELDENSNGTGKLRVIPTEVYDAIPLGNEGGEEAEEAARAMLDRQSHIPNAGGYRFYDYSAGERIALVSIAEMREGSKYGAENVYAGERVYGAFGIDLLALGTSIFGMSPFGLRFFPMLAAFGALLAGVALVRRVSGSDVAGLVFAVLFALSGFTLAYGGLGTPLMFGVFFLLLSFERCHRFYAQGMKRAHILSCVPLIIAGLSAACAVCVHGAFVLPALGVALLFAAGMVRQERVRRHYLDKAIAYAESLPEGEGEEALERVSAEQKAADVAAEYRTKRAAACASFAAGFFIGVVAVALLSMLPAYFLYVKLYDDPASPVHSIFYFMWKSFAGGFAGVNAGGAQGNPWNIFAVLARADGTAYSAVWGAFLNPVCLVAALFAVGYCVRNIVCILRSQAWGKAERKLARETAVLLGGALFCVIAALAAHASAAFVVLFYLFLFALAACGAHTFASAEGKTGRIARIVLWSALGCAVVMFALYFVFLTGLPVQALLITGIFG